jgi:hypothetical protein
VLQVLCVDCVASVVCCCGICRQQELFNVLAAYSMYNTEVGYCQGMSQIAALLLMYMQEEVSVSSCVLYSSCYVRIYSSGRYMPGTVRRFFRVHALCALKRFDVCFRILSGLCQN